MRTTLCLLLSALLISAELALSIARAQTLPDAEPPVIEMETIASGEAAARQVFTAQVVDDRDLIDVTLYHRRAGRQAFVALPMQALGDTAFYSATITTDTADLRAIEYYVQARDGGGNRTVEGFAFDPHTRTLVASSAAPIDPVVTRPVATASPREPITIGGVSWWKVALGAVAIGTLAAVAGGSGGGSAQDDGTVPLTFNLAEPQ